MITQCLNPIKAVKYNEELIQVPTGKCPSVVSGLSVPVSVSIYVCLYSYFSAQILRILLLFSVASLVLGMWRQNNWNNDVIMCVYSYYRTDFDCFTHTNTQHQGDWA